MPDLSDRAEKDGLRLFSLESALIEASPRYFLNHATDARAAMALAVPGHVPARFVGGWRNGRIWLLSQSEQLVSAVKGCHAFFPAETVR